MDISEITLDHPASYHYAIQVIRHVNESVRTADQDHKDAIHSWVNALRLAISAGTGWSVALENQRKTINSYSRHLVWLSQELISKALQADATNEAAIATDAVRIKNAAWLEV